MRSSALPAAAEAAAVAMHRQRRTSVLEQAEAQSAGLKRNTIKKQVLLGGRRISGELSRAGESWSLQRKKKARAFSAPDHPDTAAAAAAAAMQPPPSPSCGRNAVKKQMFQKVHRSISMMSHGLAPPEESEEEAGAAAASRRREQAAVPRSKSTTANSLQIPGVFERSVSVCEESVNSARKMLEDLFGRRAPPPTPQCSMDGGGGGCKKPSVSEARDDDSDQEPKRRALSLGGAAETTSRRDGEFLRSFSEQRKMAKFARDASEVAWIRASFLQTEFEEESFESVHDLMAAARSVGKTDLVALDSDRGGRRRLQLARLNTFSRSVDVFLPALCKKLLHSLPLSNIQSDI